MENNNRYNMRSLSPSNCHEMLDMSTGKIIMRPAYNNAHLEYDDRANYSSAKNIASNKPINNLSCKKVLLPTLESK